MKNFKKKSIYLALAASIGASSVAMAGGVHVNADGTGEVLLYPYYTTRGGMDTYLSIVNTKGYPKAVKVRFVEGKNSREVLDFNLYLSAFDMWTAAVVNTSTGAKVVTADKSCTAPLIASGGQAFLDFAYTGTVETGDKIAPGDVDANGINIGGSDGESTSLDRTREGYIEVIEMGEIGKGDGDEDKFPAKTFIGITHVNGVPKDCSVVQGLKANDEKDGANQKLIISTPTGGLTGSASLIAPGSGTDFSFDPVALDNFAKTELWHKAGTIDPDLRHGRKHSVRFYDEEVVHSEWDDSDVNEYAGSDWSLSSVQAVNATLMHASVINEFVLDNVTLSGTDWVVTMPTKRYSVPIKDPNNAAHAGHHALQPFTSTFWAGGACEPVSIEYWDREEQEDFVEGFSPPPNVNNALCWEANVITFNDSNILSSANSVNININDFQNGWMKITFDAEGHKLSTRDVAPNNHTYSGLPAIGFMVQDFVNMNAAPGVMATYGGNFRHKYESHIVCGSGECDSDIAY